ncbi:MAG: TonB-dependent receptor [Sphingomonas sp.]|uniref:TonB-dependent receptor n=1 Tax=Sphingomonas sp. TaxID=28214 RepID=UPI0025DE82FF|nr:TonB-dependent receptor [Sphingomonas sp.]MBY0283855.1 TonB-dependent receptor [Sphingomonas sp.]
MIGFSVRKRLLAAALLGSVAAPAIAQDAPATPEAKASSDDVVVTAQRREERLKDVPVSVAAISGDRLDLVQSGGNDIRALAGRVPSLNIESSFGRAFPRFYIRGLGNTDFDLNASQPVSLVYDDVVLENPILKGFPIFDLQRVEVLRGPQGTLFGRNTPAGIVKFDSVRPSTPGGYLRASGGSYGTVNIEGAATLKVSDTFSARFSTIYQRRGNWVDNVATPQRGDLEGYSDWAGRVQLEWKPTDALTARATGQVRILDGTARVFRANLFARGSSQLIGLGGPGTPFRRDQVRQDGVNFQRLRNYNGGLTVDYDFGPVTLTSVSSYWNGTIFTRGDIDGGFGNQFAPPFGPGFIPFSAQSQDNIPSLDQFTQELRLASNGSGPFNWQGGFFYFNEKLRIDSLDFGTPSDLNPAAIAIQRQSSDAFGVFGSATYKFDFGLTLQGGVRYNNDRRTLTASRPIDTRPGFLGFGGPVPLQTARVGSDIVTWDVSATQKVTDEVNFYARVARGYRAPSIQGRLAFGRTLSVANSERTLSVEGGFKSVYYGGKLRLNVNGFYFTTDDLQLTAVGGASNFTTLFNARNVDGYGLEAELEATPIERLNFTAGISLNNNRINDPNAFVAGCGSNCTVLNTQRVGSPGIFSINGNRLPQSPKWTANWTARYAHPVGNGELYVGTDWVFRSEIQFFLYRSVEYRDRFLLEGGLRVGYKTGPFDFAAYVRNIADDQSAVGGVDFNNLTGFVNEPRIAGFEVGFKF